MFFLKFPSVESLFLVHITKKNIFYFKNVFMGDLDLSGNILI